MPKRSKVYELPSSLIKQINEALLSKKLTLKNLKTFINSHKLNNGIEISPSSLGRYKQAFDKSTEKIQLMEHLLQTLPEEVDFSKDSKFHQFFCKIVQTRMYELFTSEDLKPQEIMLLARANKDTMASARDRERIRIDLEKEIKNEQATKLDYEGKKLGLSDEAITKLKAAMSS